MPEVATPSAQPELPLTQPQAATPSRAARFEIPEGADIVSLKNPPEVPAAPKAQPAAAKTPSDNTAESATATPEGETPPVEEKQDDLTPEQAAKREQRRAQNRLEKVLRQRAEAKARADFLQAELDKTRATTPPAPAAGEPTLAQFDYDPEKYAAAKAEFAKTQATKDIETKQREATQKAQRDALIASWEEKVDRAADKYDDFSTVVGELQPTNAFIAAIMDAENGEDVAYHLGKHPKEAERISKLPPLSQAREIGKLEAKLLAEPKKPKTPSKAPAPITPVSGTTPAPTDKVAAKDISDDEWMRARRKQVAARRH